MKYHLEEKKVKCVHILLQLSLSLTHSLEFMIAHQIGLVTKSVSTFFSSFLNIFKRNGTYFAMSIQTMHELRSNHSIRFGWRFFTHFTLNLSVEFSKDLKIYIYYVLYCFLACLLACLVLHIFISDRRYVRI